MFDTHRVPLLKLLSFPPVQVGGTPARHPVRLWTAGGQVRALSLNVLAMALLGLSGCLAHQGPPREWLVYVREVPVARVTLAGASQGNVVDVAVRGGTADVTLRHRGQASVTPVQAPPGMKVALREVDVRALARGEYDEVERALEEAPPGHADDTARDVLEATADEELASVLRSERGPMAVARLYSALTDGSLWDDEREQSRRVLTASAQGIGPEKVAQAIVDERTKVIPVRGFGATVANPVSLRVELTSDGLDVFVDTKVYAYPESKTLPMDWLRFHVRYDEVVGVRLYDEDGATRFAPALYLVEVANQNARHTLLKCGEAFTFGLTLGVGATAGAAGAAGGRLATTLMWCDRAAITLMALTTVVDEHRAWILEKYGEKGARFLRYSDGLSSLVAFYAVGRLATAVPKVVVGLRNAYLEMKAMKLALSAEEKATLELLGRRTEEALKLVERGGDVIPIERAKAPKPALQMEPVQIRATGTEGKLVPVGEGQARSPTVASAGEGGGNRPLRAAPPSSAEARTTGGRGGRTVAAAAASAESDIATALMRRGLSEQQARAAARLAAEAGVVEKVQALVNRPGYRNPENLTKFLRKWNATEGKVQALDDAVARLEAGHEVALEGGGADVVDYTAHEAIQHKRIFGGGETALGDNLAEAAEQLRGAKGEIPPEGFKKVIDVRFDPRSSHPLKGGDRNAVRAAFAERVRLEGVDRVLVTTDKSPAGRPFEFDPPFPLH